MRLMQMKQKEEAKDSAARDVDALIALEESLLKVNKSYDSVLLNVRERNPNFATLDPESGAASKISIKATEVKLGR